MDLSVVVVTLNGRDALVDCLDALAAAVPGAQSIVVNGPSADGTTGMVRERSDVDALLELADRNVNVARNAGATAADGDVVAFVDETTTVSDGWGAALGRALSEAEVATGPARRSLPVGSETSGRTEERIGRRTVPLVDGANLAIRRGALDRLDGFDEYLRRGGARDLAHRLAALDLGVEWSSDLLVSRAAAAAGDTGGSRPGELIRDLAYVFAKNYGTSPPALRRVVGSMHRSGLGGFRRLLAGESGASEWLADGLATARGCLRGSADGFGARVRDRRPARNPNGISARGDRIVRRYDW